MDNIPIYRILQEEAIGIVKNGEMRIARATLNVNRPYSSQANDCVRFMDHEIARQILVKGTTPGLLTCRARYKEDWRREIVKLYTIESSISNNNFFDGNFNLKKGD